MKGYLEMYLECSKEHGFKPDNLQEIVRYLLVNGHIHLTEENLALIGDRVLPRRRQATRGNGSSWRNREDP